MATFELLTSFDGAPNVADLLETGEKTKFAAWQKTFAGDGGLLVSLPSTRVDVTHLDHKQVLPSKPESGFNKSGFYRTKLAEVGGRIAHNPSIVSKSPAKAVRWYAGQQYICNSCSRDLIDVAGATAQFASAPESLIEAFSLVTIWPAGGQPGNGEIVVCNECARNRENLLLAAFRGGLTGNCFAKDKIDVASFVAYNLNLADAMPFLGPGNAGGYNPDGATKLAAKNGWPIDWLLNQHNRRTEGRDATAARLAQAAKAAQDAIVAEEETAG